MEDTKSIMALIIKRLFQFAFILLIAFTCALPLSAKANNKVYLLAVSACPPWKNEQFVENAKEYKLKLTLNSINSCKNTVDLMSKALSYHYNIPKKNIYELINKEATFKNLHRVFVTLRKKLTNQDQLIVYFALHGTEFNIEGVEHELLLLWSDEFPSNLFTAYVNNQAIETINVIKALKEIPAGSKLLILESCYSGFGTKNFINNKDGLTIIASSEANQPSNFSQNFNYPLFSKIFALELLSSPKSDSLTKIFAVTKMQVEVDVKKICKEHVKLMHEGGVKHNPCRQVPQLVTGW